MLKVNQLTKSYKSFSFGPIDIEVEQGAIVALVGPNGSGKSTFFRLLMNQVHEDQGVITWNNENVRYKETSFKQSVGYVGIGLYNVFEQLSIKELTSFVSYWYSNWDHEWYESLVERYEIDLSEKYRNCSTGTKKKIDFILAIAHHPSLLLLDEPSSGIDLISQRKMKEDLMDYMESGARSIIIATHQQDEIKQLSDYIWFINQGQIIDQFEKDELQECWARIWISSLPKQLEDHPNVKSISHAPLQIVTDHLPNVEEILQEKDVQVTHRQRLELDEVMEYYFE
ncbi:ATP-binding cassette domain-containing protein [Halalkalibacter sp. AB-rgal2]